MPVGYVYLTTDSSAELSAAESKSVDFSECLSDALGQEQQSLANISVAVLYMGTHSSQAFF